MPSDLTPEALAAYTVQDYSPAPLIEGVRWLPFRRFVDDGGSFFEMGRLAEDAALLDAPEFHVRQVSFSEILPGAIKAFHLHPHQTDIWFSPPSHRLLVGLCDVRRDSPTRGVVMRLILGDGQNQALIVPPGVAHGCANLWTAPASVFYFTDHHFGGGEETEEGRLPWDFLGAEFWTHQKG